jgi:hypothetical protein
VNSAVQFGRAENLVLLARLVHRIVIVSHLLKSAADAESEAAVPGSIFRAELRRLPRRTSLLM